MISVEQALEIVLASTPITGVEMVPLRQSLGRVLAQSVCADIDHPPFDRAKMDGYALRSSDTLQLPVSLRIVGEVAAGDSSTNALHPGEAIKISTGAPVPAGADAVEKIEQIEEKENLICLTHKVEAGQLITPRGSEVRAGQRVLETGIRIGPQEIAILSTSGMAEVPVACRPGVSILSTGNELVEINLIPSGSKIRDSNRYSIAALAEREGAQIRVLGIIRDSVMRTVAALQTAMESCDVIITSGGVSAGEHDLVREAILALGGNILFDRVRMRPGKPTVFARVNDKFLFCLPGNPVSSSVAFLLFVRPFLRKAQGDASFLLPSIRVRLEADLLDSSSRRSYLPGRMTISDGNAQVTALAWKGSSDLVPFAEANTLIIVPEDVHEIKRGELVEVLLMNG
jgi:molybdenum cofactor synthesis domain-containing protein